MRNIAAKHCELSTVYLCEYGAWEEGTSNDKAFDTYNSSNFRHYCSIKMELLRRQDGLCAYTEKRLCNLANYDESQWNNGRYVSDCKKMHDAKGQLEHFDPSLKGKRPWDWRNLFVTDSDANTKKLQKAVDVRFKPDNPTYNPFDWLDYDRQTHLFTPKPSLPPDDYKAVAQMLIDLGISGAREDRRVYLEDKLDDIDMGIKLKAQVESTLAQYPTAFAFCVEKLGL